MLNTAECPLTAKLPHYSQCECCKFEVYGAGCQHPAVNPAPQKITWTIKDANAQFPPDEELLAFALLLPKHNAEHAVFHMRATPFQVERFGNSARVYVSTKHEQLKSVGLFTWGVCKNEI